MLCIHITYGGKSLHIGRHIIFEHLSTASPSEYSYIVMFTRHSGGLNVYIQETVGFPLSVIRGNFTPRMTSIITSAVTVNKLQCL